jgi:ribosomal-protein-serine acetyltransferase
MCDLPLADSAHLRLLKASDAPMLHALIEANRPQLARWLPWAPPQTQRQTLEFIRRSRIQRDDNDGFQAAVVCDDEIAGVIGYHSIDWTNRSTSLGYWLGEAHQGQGTMTAAVRLLTDHALTTWELHRVEIRAAVENRRSRAIPERLGFREEGTLRDAERVGERYLDCVVYSMLGPDWP